jgi:hypothetical protein
MHIADVDKGMLGANGIVGAGAPIAVGAALAAGRRAGAGRAERGHCLFRRWRLQPGHHL